MSNKLINHAADHRVESNGKWDEIVTRLCYPEVLKWHTISKLDKEYIEDYLGAKYGCKLLREAYVICFIDDLCIFKKDGEYWLLKCLDNT